MNQTLQNKKCFRSLTIWLTGLSGSGKTTIANALKEKLTNMSINVYILDGDILRKGLNNNLGFSPEDRSENIRRSAEVCRILNDSGVMVIAAFISPFIKDRKMASEIIEKDNFFEIFVDADIETCIKRDPKGLYEKALAGNIPEFTGISSPYEKPDSPDLKIDTTRCSAGEAAETILKMILG